MVDQGISMPLMELKGIRLDGSIVEAEVAGVPINFEGQPAAMFVIRDITGRKQVERELCESEKALREQVEYLNTLMNSMNEMFYTYDLQGNITFVRPE